jgi:quinohemoprotein ethanol dehydrogenase
VHALGEPGKTGWLYLLNRATGKPLYGIPEQSVPQSKFEKTSPTQPIPSSGAFMSHTVSAAGLKGVRAAAAAAMSKDGVPPKVLPGPVFSPPSHGGTLYASTPGSLGGSDWPPSSYNPVTQMFYVCAQISTAAYTGGELADSSGQKFGSAAALGGLDNPGVFVAVDARSGRIAWQRRWSDSCYSGSVTTAGNLVFVGRNGGELQAYDATNGMLLWSFQTGAGANSTATPFSLGGNEVIAYYAAGNALAGDAHGDNLWLFGIDGTLGPVAPGKTSAAQPHAGEAKAKAVSLIQVQGGEFFFKLSSRTAKVGKVTFVFKNVGHIGHDFAVHGKSTPVISPGKTAKLVVTFTKPGQYEYLCTVPGHASAGMKGMLAVSS